jgi:hypothetical protein
MIPSKLIVTLFPVCERFPIRFSELASQVHINPKFSEEKKQLRDEFDMVKLNITSVIHHGEVPKNELKYFVEQGIPLYKAYETNPKRLLDEIKQILKSHTMR